MRCIPSLALALLLVSRLSAGQMFVTEHFQIVYDRDSVRSAGRLASIAEEEYQSILDYLDWDGAGLGTLRVAVTSKDDLANASYSSFPQSHILISNTDYGLDLDVWEDQLRGVFRHELFHYLSLSEKHSFWNAVSDILGDSYTPVYFQQAVSLTEGSAVAFERGRLLDPRYQALLLQAKWEGKFPKRYLDMSGVRDTNPNGDLTYLFSGAFWDWVRERYGSKAYGAFLRATNNLVVPVDFASLFPRFFGCPLNVAFEAFKARIPLVEADNHCTPIWEYDVLYDQKAGHILYGISSSGALFLDGEQVAELPGLVSAELDRQGTEILAVVEKHGEGGTHRALYLVDGKRTRKLQGSRVIDAAWLDDQVVTITWNDDHQVLHLPDGDIGLSLKLRNLTGLSDGRLAALARIGGQWSLVVIAPDKSAICYPLGDGVVPASLLYDGNRLWFTWAREGTLLRAGFLEGNALWLLVADEAGGIQRACSRLVQQRWFERGSLGTWEPGALEWERVVVAPRPVMLRQVEPPASIAIQSMDVPCALYAKGTFLPYAAVTSLSPDDRVEDTAAFGLFWTTGDLAETWRCQVGGGWGQEQRKPVSLATLSGQVAPLALSWRVSGQIDTAGAGEVNGSLAWGEGFLGANASGAYYHVDGINGLTGTFSLSVGYIVRTGFHPLAIGGVVLTPSVSVDRQWPSTSPWRNLGLSLFVRIPRLLPFETYGNSTWNWPLSYRFDLLPASDTYLSQELSILLYGREIQRALPWVRLYCYRMGVYGGLIDKYRGDLDASWPVFTLPEDLEHRLSGYLSLSVSLTANNQMLAAPITLTLRARYDAWKEQPFRLEMLFAVSYLTSMRW
ncbi:MAG: hypothetical protein SPF89_11930 [Sphaerochaetaceae bacterium]|nr:hypothetical protein [Spirochaetales bacterium]MDY5500802.1 hypothetical protein [Sphaerochaetaceae bacterium]